MEIDFCNAFTFWLHLGVELIFVGHAFFGCDYLEIAFCIGSSVCASVFRSSHFGSVNPFGNYL